MYPITLINCLKYIARVIYGKRKNRDFLHLLLLLAYCGNFRISQSRLLKGTNCPFASKDHVRPVSKRLCIIFMACSCPIFVLGRLKKKKKRKNAISRVTSWIKRMRIFADISSARAYNNIARAISGYPGRYPPIPYATLDWATLYVMEMLTVREK